MKNKLTDQEKEDISQKIDSEGFDYYFNDYGADPRLIELISLEIKNYIDATENLKEALGDLGVELSL